MQLNFQNLHDQELCNQCDNLCRTLSSGDERDIDGKEMAVEVKSLPSLPCDDMTTLELLTLIRKKLASLADLLEGFRPMHSSRRDILVHAALDVCEMSLMVAYGLVFHNALEFWLKALTSLLILYMSKHTVSTCKELSHNLCY